MFRADVDFLDIASRQAVRVARADRDRFLPVLRKIDEMLASQKVADVIIGGGTATAMIRRDRITESSHTEAPLDLYDYMLYSSSPLSTASKLARLIYEVDPGDLTQFTVMLPRSRSLAVINVGQRQVAAIAGLPRHRGLSVFEMLAPDIRLSYFSPLKVPCMAPEVQLMEIYRNLTLPQHAGSWPGLLVAEREVREALLDGFKAKLGEIFTGGAPKKRESYGDIRARLIGKIQTDFLQREGVIMVSGLELTVKDESRSIGSRYACLSVEDLPAVKQRLQRIAASARANIHLIENNPQVVSDNRMMRLTAYLHVPGRNREPILDVYNTASYDAIPYAVLTPVKTADAKTTSGRAEKCGTLLVLGRFILVDLWTMQLLWRMKSVSDEFAKSQMRRIVGDLRVLGAAIDAQVNAAVTGGRSLTTGGKARSSGGKARSSDRPRTARGANISLFPKSADDFIGRIEDEVLVEKREDLRMRKERRAEGKRRLIPFYPGRVCPKKEK